MLENLKNLFKDFDFRLPVSLNDITPDFLTVVLCLIALIAIIISVAVLSKKKKERLAELERADKEKPEVEPADSGREARFKAGGSAE